MSAGVASPCVSFSALGPVSSSRALERLHDAGVREVELAIGPRYERSFESTLRAYQHRGVRVRAHHAFPCAWDHGPFDLARAWDRDAMLARLDWLHAHAISAFSVHGGSYDEADAREGAYARFLSAIEWLARACRERGITLGVETMFPMPPASRRENLLSGPEELASFLRDDSRVHLVIDLAHIGLWRATDQARLAAIAMARGRVLEVHVSGNDGRRDLHSALSTQCWWWPHRRELLAQHPVVLETRVDGRGEPTLESQLELLDALFGPDSTA
jgi:sugar phosphate isomerase/epimerase